MYADTHHPTAMIHTLAGDMLTYTVLRAFLGELSVSSSAPPGLSMSPPHLQERSQSLVEETSSSLPPLLEHFYNPVVPKEFML